MIPLRILCISLLFFTASNAQRTDSLYSYFTGRSWCLEKGDFFLSDTLQLIAYPQFSFDPAFTDKNICWFSSKTHTISTTWISTIDSTISSGELPYTWEMNEEQQLLYLNCSAWFIPATLQVVLPDKNHLLLIRKK